MLMGPFLSQFFFQCHVLFGKKMQFQMMPNIFQMQQAHSCYCQLDDQQLSQDPLVLALSFPDQCEFLRLSAYFKFASDRSKRNMASAAFQKHIQIIRGFVCRGDYSDFDRGLACGVQFGMNYMLVNTKRLKAFMGRSKSCLNGCFHKLGYNVSRILTEDNMYVNQFTRMYGRQLPQVRQWCIRSNCLPLTPSQSEIQSEAQSESEIDIEPSESFLDIKNLLNPRASSI